jgi:sterol desaturase/sphingolipid hydroxylase (fatty acid hydroxylase superfamily)
MSAQTWLLAHEGGVRLAVFAGLLLALGIAERIWPTRGDARLDSRLLANLGLVALDTALLRVLFPVLAVGLASAVHARGGGLFGAVSWPPAVEFVLALLLLDLAIYVQHRLFHAWPVLWRLHRVHHSDLRFDSTTGVRFHPFEIALSMAIKLGLVLVLGPPAFAVLVFELLLSAGSLVTHTDIALPARLDRWLRWLVVTPSMHRVHHSILRAETDSNFGFHLSWWDRLFGSYRAAPQASERDMPIGIESFRTPGEQGLLALLAQPLRNVPAATAADRESTHA